MTDFLTSIIQDSRPRAQTGLLPGGADEAGADRLQAGDLRSETIRDESPDPVSAESGQIPFSPMTGPELAAPPLLPRSVSSPTTLADAGPPVASAPSNQARADYRVGSGDIAPNPLANIRVARPAGQAHGRNADSAEESLAPHVSASPLDTEQAASAGSDGKDSSSPTTSSIDANATRLGPGEPDGAMASSDLSATADRHSEEGGTVPWLSSRRKAGKADDPRPQPLRNRTTPTPTTTRQPRPMDATGADRAGAAAMTDTAPTVPVHGQSLAGVGPREQERTRHGPPPAADAFGARPVAAGPKVHIGRVDVTVTAPAVPNVQAPRFGASHRINRQYLRRV